MPEAVIQEDPHALKLYVDGSSYNNPVGASDFACIARYPEGSNRPDEEVFSEGYQTNETLRSTRREGLPAQHLRGDWGSR
jgi:hypothetical protein